MDICIHTTEETIAVQLMDFILTNTHRASGAYDLQPTDSFAHTEVPSVQVMVAVQVMDSASHSLIHAPAERSTLVSHYADKNWNCFKGSTVMVTSKLQALVSDILPPATAIGLEKLSVNGQFFVAVQNIMPISL